MENFETQLQQTVDFINENIQSYLPIQKGFQERLIEAMNYSINAGGKRLRPMLIMEAYKLCGGKNIDLLYPFMAAIECIHTYSLVHDDLPAMDNDDYRRGQLTTHKKYGEDFGVLAGDGLLNYAYELMINEIAECNDNVLRKKCAVAAQIIANKSGIYGMVGGQSLDVWLTEKEMNADELDFIFRLKTGALIEASLMAGAVLANASNDVIEKIEKAGCYIGVAFQIRDDILDITSSSDVLGKPVLSDEKNKKNTYVSIYGIEKAEEDVEELSKKALEILESCGDNEFLMLLVKMLINRKK